MARVVVSQFVTVDGMIDDPGGSEALPGGGWAFKFERGPEGDKFKIAELTASDALLLGRVTYEGFAAAWPGRDDAQGFAAKMNSMRKYVVSSTIESPTWENTVVINGDIPGEIAKLREQDGGDILVNGSAALVHLLVANKLVDEYRLMIYPVILGGGKRLFPDGIEAASLKLVESQPVGDQGVLTAVYRPAD